MSGLTLEQKRRAFKRKQYLATTTARMFMFASLYGVGSVVPVTRAGQRAKVSAIEAQAVCDTPLPWNISCYAICRDTTGHDYIKSMCITLATPVKQSSIHRALSRHHYDWMEREVNMNHLLTLAWVATTGPEPSDEVAVKIFGDMGAWRDFGYVTRLEDGGYETTVR